MFDKECIKQLEKVSMFNINIEEEVYIINKFKHMLNNFKKIENLPKTEEIIFNHIEDIII